MRECSKCGKSMNAGWIIDNVEYACSESCFIALTGYKDMSEFQKHYDKREAEGKKQYAYYTEWEDDGDLEKIHSILNGKKEK